MKTRVNIETNKGASTVSSYRGFIAEEDLTAILTGKISKPFIKLEEVHWTVLTWNEETELSEHQIVRFGKTAPYEHYHDSVWLRPEHIATITMMERF